MSLRTVSVQVVGIATTGSAVDIGISREHGLLDVGNTRPLQCRKNTKAVVMIQLWVIWRSETELIEALNRLVPLPAALKVSSSGIF